MSGAEFKEWGEIELIFAKPGEQWTFDERAHVARWLTKERRKSYLFIAFQLLRHWQDAEDEFQGFCMKIIDQGLPEFDPLKGTAHGFLLKEWRKHFRAFYERRARRAHHEVQPAVDEEGTPLVEAIASTPWLPDLVDLEQLIEILKQCLGTLPAGQREVIFRRFWEDQKFREIATIIGKSEEAVKKFVKRTIEALGKQVINEKQRIIKIKSVPPNKESKMTGSDVIP